MIIIYPHIIKYVIPISIRNTSIGLQSNIKDLRSIVEMLFKTSEYSSIMIDDESISIMKSGKVQTILFSDMLSELPFMPELPFIPTYVEFINSISDQIKKL